LHLAGGIPTYYDSLQVTNNPLVVQWIPKNVSHAYNQYHIEYVSSPGLQISMRRPAKLEGFHRQNHTMGETHYELANYLGNVHNVVSNRVLFETNIQYQEDFATNVFGGITDWLWNNTGNTTTGKAQNSGTNAYLRKPLTLTAGQTYVAKFDATTAGANITFIVSDGNGTLVNVSLATGNHAIPFTPTTSGVTLSWENSGTTYSIDNIVVQDSGRGTILAEVMQYQDYYPYGMTMPGRTGSNAQSTLYRYGMNGMERMDETSGNGNAYTTFFRQYDARLGRWMSLDPKATKFPHQSPYISMDGNPISLSDPMGDEVVGKEEKEQKAYDSFKDELASKINSLKNRISEAKVKGKDGKAERLQNQLADYQEVQNEIHELENSDDLFIIRMGKNRTDEGGAGGSVKYNAEESDKQDRNVIDVNIGSGGDFSIDENMAHELKHGYQFLGGKIGFHEFRGKYVLMWNDYNDEYEAYKRQNLFREPGNQLTEDWINNTLTNPSGQYKYRRQNFNTQRANESQSTLKNMRVHNRYNKENGIRPKYVYHEPN
jgi:RHS repeat-associated protein